MVVIGCFFAGAPVPRAIKMTRHAAQANKIAHRSGLLPQLEATNVFDKINGLSPIPVLFYKQPSDKYRLDLRCKIEASGMDGIKQGSNSHAVPGKKQRLLLLVVDGNGKLTVQIIQTFFTFFLIEVNDDLGIGLSAELMTTADELLPQFRIVEDLTVKNYP